MNFPLITRLLGILVGLFSFTMLVPALVSLIYQDGNFMNFMYSFAISFSVGVFTSIAFRKHKNKELSHRGGFLITALFWIVLGSFGALPFILSEHISISFTDSVFESLSGLTTTGATVISGLDNLPKSLLFYRQQLQWLGGIGIIVIAVAILPILGIGGMQLYRAEIPGPNKDEKLAPRITQTAKWIFIIYLGLTVACMLAYWAAGMSLFDAICHSFSTVAIGGFSTHDASLGYFDNNLILYIASFFMIISAINFTLHYYAISQRRITTYFRDPEFSFFISLVLFCIFVAVVALASFDVFSNASDTWAHGLFQVVSIFTTTGFASADFANWPSFLPIWLILLACIGGCAGSTAGGMKVIRSMIIFKQGTRELFMLVHPNAVAPIKLNNRRVPERIVSAIWSFLAVYFYVFVFILVTLMVTGLDYTTAFSATVGSLNNLGPGLGDVAQNYKNINDFAKWILCLAMLLGRLEIFTLLVILTPEFWKK